MHQLLAAGAALNYVALTRIDADKAYLPGDPVSLTQKQAQPLIDIGAIKPVDGSEQVLEAVDASELGNGVQQPVDMNAQLEDEKAAALKRLEQSEKDHADLSTAFVELQAEHKTLVDAHAELQSAHAAVVGERDALKAQQAEAPAASKSTAGSKAASKG